MYMYTLYLLKPVPFLKVFVIFRTIQFKHLIVLSRIYSIFRKYLYWNSNLMHFSYFELECPFYSNTQNHKVSTILFETYLDECNLHTASLLEVRHLLERGIRIFCKQQVNFIDETNMRLYPSFRFNDQFCEGN